MATTEKFQLVKGFLSNGQGIASPTERHLLLRFLCLSFNRINCRRRHQRSTNHLEIFTMWHSSSDESSLSPSLSATLSWRTSAGYIRPFWIAQQTSPGRNGRQRLRAMRSVHTRPKWKYVVGCWNSMKGHFPQCPHWGGDEKPWVLSWTGHKWPGWWLIHVEVAVASNRHPFWKCEETPRSSFCFAQENCKTNYCWAHTFDPKMQGTWQLLFHLTQANIRGNPPFGSCEYDT